VYDESGITGDVTHDFGVEGEQRIRITGVFPRIEFLPGDDRGKIISIDAWGDNQWLSMENAFYGCFNLNYNAVDAPNLSSLTSIRRAFGACDLFNGDLSNWDVSLVENMSLTFSGCLNFNGNIENWNVSNVNDMAFMFASSESFNRDIGTWNVSNVTNMESMFKNAESFNQDISSWDVLNVTNMHSMFDNASSFNQEIGIWDVSNVTVMINMFLSASTFNSDVNQWDVSSVTDMTRMFNNAESFNQDLNEWDVSNVLSMGYMFAQANSFNRNITTWDVSNVEFMRDMFRNTENFNQEIGGWDVSNVFDMRGMFQLSESFNGNIGTWDVSSVEEMSGMFNGAQSFNQDLDNWDVSSSENMQLMFSAANSFKQNLGNWELVSTTNIFGIFDNSGLTCENYSNTLIGWADNPNTSSNRDLGPLTGMEYGSGAAGTARDFLRNDLGWTIDGDMLGTCGMTCPTEYTITYPESACFGENISIEIEIVDGNGGPYDITVVDQNGVEYESANGAGNSSIIDIDYFESEIFTLSILLDDDSGNCPDIIRSSSSSNEITIFSGGYGIEVPLEDVCFGVPFDVTVSGDPSPIGNQPYSFTLNMEDPNTGFESLMESSSSDFFEFTINPTLAGTYGFSGSVADASGCFYNGTTNFLEVEVLPQASYSITLPSI